jgi:hypothetical protein
MLSAISGGYFLLFFLYKENYTNHSFCVFKNLTGIPCPGCGMGRATIEFFKGNFINSLLINPLAIPFIIFVIISVVWIIIDLISGKDRFYKLLTKDLPLKYKLILVFIIGINWLWNIVKGL